MINIKAFHICFSRNFCSSALRIPNGEKQYLQLMEALRRAMLTQVSAVVVRTRIFCISFPCARWDPQPELPPESLVGSAPIRARGTDYSWYSQPCFGMCSILSLAHPAVSSAADFLHHPEMRIWSFILILIWSFPAECEGSPSLSERGTVMRSPKPHHQESHCQSCRKACPMSCIPDP